MTTVLSAASIAWIRKAPTTVIGVEHLLANARRALHPSARAGVGGILVMTSNDPCHRRRGSLNRSGHLRDRKRLGRRDTCERRSTDRDRASPDGYQAWSLSQRTRCLVQVRAGHLGYKRGECYGRQIGGDAHARSKISSAPFVVSEEGDRFRLEGQDNVTRVFVAESQDHEDAGSPPARRGAGHRGPLQEILPTPRTVWRPLFLIQAMTPRNGQVHQARDVRGLNPQGGHRSWRSSNHRRGVDHTTSGAARRELPEEWADRDRHRSYYEEVS